jgi:hypothetical protein
MIFIVWGKEEGCRDGRWQGCACSVVMSEHNARQGRKANGTTDGQNASTRVLGRLLDGWRC